MPVIVLSTRISADCETVFDLARNVELHVESTAQTREKVVAGRTSGLLELGERVTWEATHLGIRQRLTIEITEYDRPHRFRDTMIAGAFKRFDHDHHFEPEGAQTLMTDIFDYTAPLRLLGRLVDWMFLERYMRQLLEKRNNVIKHFAESGHGDACAPTE